MVTLAAVLFQPNFAGIFTIFLTWVLQAISAGAVLFFVIDLSKHIFGNPRDLKAAGVDTIVLILLIVLASQAGVLIPQLLTAAGATIP